MTQTTLKTTLTDPITGKTIARKPDAWVFTKNISDSCKGGYHKGDCPRDHNALIKVLSFEDTKNFACHCGCHWQDNWTEEVK